MPVSDYHLLMRYSLIFCGCFEVWILLPTVCNVICSISKYITISLKKAMQKIPLPTSILLCLLSVAKYHQVMLCYMCLMISWFINPDIGPQSIFKNVGLLAIVLQTHRHTHKPTHTSTLPWGDAHKCLPSSTVVQNIGGDGVWIKTLVKTMLRYKESHICTKWPL